MGRLGAVWEESGMLLAILPNEKDARPAAVALLDKLRTSENSAPKGQASVGGASVSGGSISNAGAVVAEVNTRKLDPERRELDLAEALAFARLHLDPVLEVSP